MRRLGTPGRLIKNSTGFLLSATICCDAFGAGTAYISRRKPCVLFSSAMKGEARMCSRPWRAIISFSFQFQHRLLFSALRNSLFTEFILRHLPIAKHTLNHHSTVILLFVFQLILKVIGMFTHTSNELRGILRLTPIVLGSVLVLSIVDFGLAITHAKQLTGVSDGVTTAKVALGTTLLVL